MIIQLINMNFWLRKYPVEVWVTASPEFPLSPIVSDLNPQKKMLPPRNTSRPSARLALGERASACVAHLSPLFNFTSDVPKGYLISWMGDSSNTHTVFLSFL
jgi:hypothetical protein